MKTILFIFCGVLAVTILVTILIFRWSILGSIPDHEYTKKFKESKQYNLDKRIFENRDPQVLEKMRKEAFSFSTVIEWLSKGVGREPQSKLPQVKPDITDFLRPTKSLKVIWFGHSTFLLNFSGKIILVDPVFTQSASPFSFMVKRFQAPVLSLEELPSVDYILISHDHYDHLDMETIKFFSKKNSLKFITPLGVGSHLIKWGIESRRIIEFDWWEQKKLSDIEFIATPAQHFSGRSPFNENQTLWASWVIRNQEHNIYFSGDSGYDTHFKIIGEKFGPFDVAFIENGQYNLKWRAVHSLPEEAAQAFIDLRAKKFFPIHWGMFVLAFHGWRDPIDRLASLAKEKNISLVTPKIGEIAILDDSYKNLEWWAGLQ